jgi:hypothetical protein
LDLAPIFNKVQRFFTGGPPLTRRINFKFSPAIFAFVVLFLLSACPRKKDAGETFYFDSDGKYGPGKNAEIRAANLKVVEKYRSLYPVGGEEEVFGWTDGQCGPVPHNYRFSSQADGFHVEVRVRLKMPNVSLHREQEMLALVRGCVPKMKTLWENYGVHFEVQYDSTHFKSIKNPHAYITMSDAKERSDSLNYYLGHHSDEEFCLVDAHETGHLVGLSDEYFEEGTCRVSRPIDENPWSVMNNQYKGWEKIEFFPRHLETIISQVNREKLRFLTKRDLKPTYDDLGLYIFKNGKLLSQSDKRDIDDNPVCRLYATDLADDSVEQKLVIVSGTTITLTSYGVPKIFAENYVWDLKGRYAAESGKTIEFRLYCENKSLFGIEDIEKSLGEENGQSSYGAKF